MGFCSDLSCPRDYHRLMLIEVVTSMNTDTKERRDGYFQVRADFRQTVCNNEQAVDCMNKDSFFPQLFRKMLFEFSPLL